MTAKTLDKRLIYIFLFFLVFEGAFRKWGPLSLSSPMALIRDPFVLLIVARGFIRGYFKRNTYVKCAIVLSFVSVLTALLSDKTNLTIIYYGTRIFLLYFPAIWVFAKVLNRNDLYRIGRICLYLSIPMTILVVMQFFSPQSAWVNRGVGNDIEGSGFGGALGYYRPSAVFSFTQGYICYQAFVATFLVMYFFDKRAQFVAPIKKILLLVILACYLVSIPMSISRTLLFQTIAIAAFIFLAMICTGKGSGKAVLYMVLIAFLVPLLMQIDGVQTMMEVFQARFESAANSEGEVLEDTIGNRYFGALIRPWTIDVPFWGHGIGLGTRVGLKFFPTGLITDEEGTRIIYESGYLVGSMYILLRYVLTLSLIVKAFKWAKKRKDMLPILFIPSMFFLLPQGSWGNSVPLGFAVLAVSSLLILLKPEK